MTSFIYHHNIAVPIPVHKIGSDGGRTQTETTIAKYVNDSVEDAVLHAHEGLVVQFEVEGPPLRDFSKVQLRLHHRAHQNLVNGTKEAILWLLAALHVPGQIPPR